MVTSGQHLTLGGQRDGGFLAEAGILDGYKPSCAKKDERGAYATHERSSKEYGTKATMIQG